MLKWSSQVVFTGFSLAPTSGREERAFFFSDFLFIVVVLLWQRYFTPGEMGRLAKLRAFCLSFQACGRFVFSFLFFKRKRFDKIQVAQSWLTRGKGMSTKLPRKKLEAFYLLDGKCM